MVKKSRPSVKKSPGDQNVKLPKIGGGGGGDILGQRHRLIKQVDNNTLYGAGALILLAGGGYIAFQNGWLNNIPFISSLFTANTAAPTNVQVTPIQVPQGSAANAVGNFNPTATNTFYAVYNSTGTAVLNGTLGTNVSSFNTSLATQSLPLGSYTIVVSDQPIAGPPPGASTGQVLGTNTQLQDVFTPTATTSQTVAGTQGTGASGPSNITLG